MHKDNFAACIVRQILLGWWNQWGWSERDMFHAWVRTEMFRGVWLGVSRERIHWEDLGLGGR